MSLPETVRGQVPFLSALTVAGRYQRILQSNPLFLQAPPSANPYKIPLYVQHFLLPQFPDLYVSVSPVNAKCLVNARISGIPHTARISCRNRGFDCGTSRACPSIDGTNRVARYPTLGSGKMPSPNGARKREEQVMPSWCRR